MPEVQQMNNTSSNCMGCGNLIKDQYIYKVQPDMQWHESCLKCSECNCRLEENSTCFIRNQRAYCKQDYARLFAVKCNKCNLGLKRNDLIMKSKTKLYHLECFCCCLCSKKLLPGEEYFQTKDGLLYCKDDSVAILSGSSFHQHNYLSSTMTPESSVTSLASFSPSNGSSSSSSTSSSIVDSPSSISINNNLIYQQPIGYNNNLQHHHHLQQQPQRICEKYTENDSYQDKEEEENSLSDHDETNPGILNDLIHNNEDDDDDVDEEDDDQDVSLSGDDDQEDDSSFNDHHHHSKKHKLKHKHSSNKKLKHNNNVNHHNNLMYNTSTSSPNSNYLHSCFSSGSGGSSSSNGKPARIRTVLNEKQLHTLRACYGANPRPDALMKEQLVEMTGLNPRVIRVWFQNKRCKDKKKNMLVRPNDHQFNSNHGNNNSNLIQLPTQHSMYDSCY